MRRRHFVAGLLVAATTGRARAQQAPKVYHIAMVLRSLTVAQMTEAGGDASFRAFYEELRRLGYVEGQNLLVERYSATGSERYPELAREVVGTNPDLIITATNMLVQDFKAATVTTPIVMVGADPVTAGTVTSLARPGGNITGVTLDAGAEIWGKRLGLLWEAFPGLSKAGFLASRRAWEFFYEPLLRELAGRSAISLVVLPLDPPFDEPGYRRAFAAMAQEGVDALIVSDQPEHRVNGPLIAELAANARLPTIYSYREEVAAGGLMAYAADLVDLNHHLADQIDQVLRGANPGEIPFYQARKFDLIINVRAAKALGLTIPASLLTRADEVIE